MNQPQSVFLELKVPPVLLVLIIAGFMWLLSISFPSLDVSFPYSYIAVVVLASLGIGVALAGVFEFRKAHTTVDPRTPDQTANLVQSGIFKFSRNPMYVGFALLLMALAIWLGNSAAMALIVVYVLYMNRFQILPEERFMSAKFGAAYDQYRGKVRRWL
ncbi:isoprenylcysteine carboxylmethyltransferase family protein [Alteromonas sp. ASW11-36]|uniref:Isoprenylcysteine carboxylmethyltransferase family protein n=1 Tax=Alteromonas arenosi TaxID=3055817 RepID=A0ABT7T1L1_9ALTE|nr:isoprenylcysteine carboxylmethyltransferase family protein [Alteromonas sp. ASW11-36]MDM7862317.1 isoprenylcysteine carboxylmethyltransferase family protein [Alteromonas sp. ASW11-36]